jgi:outer membrane lipoprotein-sorting protein
VKASTGYSKRLLRIRQDNFVTIRADYWDQGGQPLKVYLAADVRATDAGRGKFQAMRQETSNLQTGHRTVLTFTNFKVNQGVKDEFFTTRYMEREQ